MVTDKVDGRQGREGGKQGLKEPGWALHGVGNGCRAVAVAVGSSCHCMEKERSLQLGQHKEADAEPTSFAPSKASSQSF